MIVAMVALVASVAGYTAGSFGTASAMIALASVGVGLGALNDAGRSSSSR